MPVEKLNVVNEQQVSEAAERICAILDTVPDYVGLAALADALSTQCQCIETDNNRQSLLDYAYQRAMGDLHAVFTKRERPADNVTPLAPRKPEDEE